MTNISDNKKAYLDYKEKLLADIKYYEKSIEEFRANDKNNNYYDDNSSDSEDDWMCAKDTVPKAIELRRQQTKLRTYLQATQELTGLTILQFEVNVLVEDPNINGEPPVSEPGTWREVAAECRADLVPFSITFYVHTPDRKFGQLSYRSARVVLVKAAHEAELAHSALHSLTTPSDAVEVLRSYAAAYRARRTTLAHLANKYTNTLHMEPHKEGGFVFKCANLLEVVWRLENKWSPVAPFHHKMKFDLEYMEESYIKTISQCHKQLSDPSLQTDERTLILAKIITTCLEAKGPESHEAVESDLESKTTDCDAKRDSEVMAPPKSIPKKAKAKNAANTAQKRSNDGSKRMKTNDNDENARNVPNEAQKTSSNNGSKRMRTNDNDENAKNMPNTAQKRNINEGSKGMRSNDDNDNTDNNENINIPNTAPKRSIQDNNSLGSKRMKSNDIKNVKDTGNTVTAKISNTDNINKNSNTKNKTDKTKKSIATAKNSANKNPKTTEANENAVANAKNVNDNKTKTVNTKISSNSKEAKNPDINANTKNKTDKTKAKNEAPTKNLISSSKEKTADGVNSNNEANAKNKLIKDKNKTKNAANTNTASTKDTNKINNIVTKNKDKIKSVTNAKNGSDSANNENIPQNSNAKNAIGKPNSVAKTKNHNKVASLKNLTSKDSKSNANTQQNTKNIPKNTVTEKNIATTRNKDKIANINGIKTQDKILSGNLNNKFSRNISLRTGNIKSSIFKAGNTEKENGGLVSKIPQKKLTPISEKSLKPNPSRISPRTFPSKFRTLSNKNIAKTTNIPILKKSVSKQ